MRVFLNSGDCIIAHQHRRVSQKSFLASSSIAQIVHRHEFFDFVIPTIHLLSKNLVVHFRTGTKIFIGQKEFRMRSIF